MRKYKSFIYHYISYILLVLLSLYKQRIERKEPENHTLISSTTYICTSYFVSVLFRALQIKNKDLHLKKELVKFRKKLIKPPQPFHFRISYITEASNHPPSLVTHHQRDYKGEYKCPYSKMFPFVGVHCTGPYPRSFQLELEGYYWQEPVISLLTGQHIKMNVACTLQNLVRGLRFQG